MFKAIGAILDVGSSVLRFGKSVSDQENYQNQLQNIDRVNSAINPTLNRHKLELFALGLILIFVIIEGKR